MRDKLVFAEIWAIEFSCKPAFILRRLQLTPRPICWLIPQPRTTSSHKERKTGSDLHYCITLTHTHPHRNFLCLLSLMLLTALFPSEWEFSSSVTGWSAVAVARVRCPIGPGRFMRPRCVQTCNESGAKCDHKACLCTPRLTYLVQAQFGGRRARWKISCWPSVCVCEAGSECLFEKRKMCLYVHENSRPLKETVALCVSLLSP